MEDLEGNILFTTCPIFFFSFWMFYKDLGGIWFCPNSICLFFHPKWSGVRKNIKPCWFQAGSWFNTDELKCCSCCVRDGWERRGYPGNTWWRSSTQAWAQCSLGLPSGRWAGGTCSDGNVFFSICAHCDGKKINFCLPILSACKANAAASLEFVYSQVWEEESV